MTACSCATGKRCPKAEGLWKARVRALTKCCSLDEVVPADRAAYFAADKALVNHQKAAYRQA